MKKKPKKTRKKNNLTKKSRKKLIAASVLSAALILSITLLCVFAPKRASGKPNFFETENEFVNGIDVSHHNGEIDWSAAAENADFVIIRAGYRGYAEGKIGKDRNFTENIKGANKAGIPVGVYFYSQAITVQEAEEEAEFVLLELALHKTDLPVFIDYEYAFDADGMLGGRLFNADLSPDEAAAVINAFCEKINSAGLYAGVYASSSVLNDKINTRALNDDIYIWVADYNKNVKFRGKYDIWQYSKTGQCSGVSSKHTDLNRWYIK